MQGGKGQAPHPTTRKPVKPKQKTAHAPLHEAAVQKRGAQHRGVGGGGREGAAAIGGGNSWWLARGGAEEGASAGDDGVPGGEVEGEGHEDAEEDAVGDAVCVGGSFVGWSGVSQSVGQEV